MNTDFIDFRK